MRDQTALEEEEEENSGLLLTAPDRSKNLDFPLKRMRKYGKTEFFEVDIRGDQTSIFWAENMSREIQTMI